jgi:hypothetical protein
MIGRLVSLGRQVTEAGSTPELTAQIVAAQRRLAVAVDDLSRSGQDQFFPRQRDRDMRRE